MAESKFPADAGHNISNTKAQGECQKYCNKYPDRADKFSLNRDNLVNGIKRAMGNGASAIGLLNCLNGDNEYIGVGFVTEEGTWVDKDEQTVKDFNSFKEKNPGVTAGVFWGVDYALPWISAQDEDVVFSNAIDDQGRNTILGPSDYSGGKDADEEGTPNGGTLCPLTCPGDD